MATTPEPTKADIALRWIASGWIRVHFDATRDDVDVPRHLREDEGCVLEFGLVMPTPIRDLKIDQGGISGTLLFDVGSVWIRLPWRAVFCIAQIPDDQVAVWWRDAPPAVQRAMLTSAGKSANDKLRAKRLHAVKAVKKADPKKKHLRLVK